MSTAAQTFLFADVAGFTALTEAHGDEQAADLVAELARQAGELCEAGGGRVVKTIGDALMVRAPDAADGVRLGLAIALDLGRSHGSPAIRVGMNHGEAVERAGDWFGSAVNVAARVSAAAEGGEVLLSGAAREAAGEVEGVEFEPRGRRELRGLPDPVELFAALRRASSGDPDHAIDPVCRMAVDPRHTAGRLTHEGTVYLFCSMSCVRRFAERPEVYARPPGDPGANA